MKTSIKDLAEELLEQICEAIPLRYNSTQEDIVKDLCNLRLVSRQLRYAPDPVLFREVPLNARKKRILSFLDATTFAQFKEKNQAIFRYCKVLKIQFGKDADADGVGRIKMVGMSNDFIPGVLSGLQQVESVEWTVEPADPCPLIVSALSALPNLKTLLLIFSGTPYHDLSLLDIPSLERLLLSGVADQRFCERIIEQASVLLARGSLTHLAINGASFSTARASVLLPLPKATEPTTQVSRLRQLQLQHCGLRFKGRPQFGSLTHLEVQHRYHQAVASIWTLLKQADIRLKVIVVDTLPFPLIQYLKTYSGLERFSYLPEPGIHGWGGLVMNAAAEESDEDVFYGSILPLHHDTITSLALSSFTPQNWEGKNSYTSALVKCVNLTNLSLTVDVANIGNDPVHLRQLLGTLLTFGRLEAVAILWTIADYRLKASEALYVWGIERNIMEYPLPSLNAFKISTIKNFFQPERKDNGYRWTAAPTAKVTGVAARFGWSL
ncbi:hypothetical protein BKA70DRAFT_1272571 [Coprinopsis sp. MPI-PUGE-AT-0042]|nr:hypothetical protein BKA70DRAFT_1272571 [Coprinopsis sp. MPI-PUGE-AT-0042]